MTHRISCAFSILALVVACGGTGTGGNGDGDGGAGGDGDGGASCTSAEECGTGVCDPATNTCSDTVSCDGHDDCGPGGHCQTGGTCASSTTGDPCDTAVQCTMNEGCVGGYCGCGGDQFIAEAVPPNVLILLDRSGSMDGDINGTSKYEIAQTAITNLLSTYGATVRFGLSVYPRDNNCGAGNINVDVGPGTATDINTAIGANTPNNGLTPIGDTLDALATYTPLQDTTRENYVLLITDGSETCDGDGEAAVTALRGQTPEVQTFVVGFGSGIDAGALNDMAQAGGTALAGGPPFYYQADDAVSLNMALDAIGGAVLSCTYVLDQVPESADFFVYFDDVPISESMSDGWSYDPDSNTVTFTGAACDSLRAGDVSDLVIVHNCPVVVP